MTNYIVHPVLQDMINLGCRNQFSVGIAFQVYMDLCEVQALRDVKYLYSRELDLLYLTGTKGRSHDSASPEIFLPLSTISEITPAWIRKVQDTLCADEVRKGITLAMKEHDSTVVYYRMMQGLVPPDSPETARRKKQRDEAKHCIEVEMRRMRHELLARAQKSVPEEGVETSQPDENKAEDVEMPASTSEVTDMPSSDKQVCTENSTVEQDIDVEVCANEEEVASGKKDAAEDQELEL
ncbi:tRNA-splicing endonuclease subunit Sen15-like [Periplaneta americana]|uniref:tRNA-splicing endonuclease subunit Sen15-like n=1 Tax=Periplaneta americana TaxID=6978 RepID=UPI0037E89E1A